MIKEIHISSRPLSENNPIHFGEEKNNHSNLHEEEFELPIDIARRGRQLIIKAPIVGATPDDINITINDNILFIYKGVTIDKEKIDNYYIKECHWGTIAREIHLPLPVDPSGTRASLKDGILRITLPIVEKKKTKVIKIK